MSAFIQTLKKKVALSFICPKIGEITENNIMINTTIHFIGFKIMGFFWECVGTYTFFRVKGIDPEF